MIFLEDFTACVDDMEEALRKALEAIRKLKSQIARLVGAAEDTYAKFESDTGVASEDKAQGVHDDV
jgi:hypothetical protein